MKTYNCAECPETKRALRHCLTASSDVVFEIGSEKFYRCPARIMIELQTTLNEYTNLYNCLQVGVLPNTGGLDKQANKLMEIVAYVGAMKAASGGLT